MTWATCSPAGWGAGGSPGIRTSSNWLASKVTAPASLLLHVLQSLHTQTGSTLLPLGPTQEFLKTSSCNQAQIIKTAQGYAPLLCAFVFGYVDRFTTRAFLLYFS